MSLASFDELSPEGRGLLSGLCEANGMIQSLITNIKDIGLAEAEKILTRMNRRARHEQLKLSSIIQALHLPKAFPELASSFIVMLGEIPASARPPALIPQLKKEAWAKRFTVSLGGR